MRDLQSFHFVLKIIISKMRTLVAGCSLISRILYNVKYFNEIKRLKSLQKAEAYSEPKQASMMELFREYN